MSRHEVFRELAQLPAVLEVIDQMLGDDCILSGVNMRSVLPGSAPQTLHRDTEIWGPSLFWMDYPIGINVGWAFDDFTAENGATRIVPGSHRRPDASAAEPMVALEAPAGSLLAFDARLIHGAGENCSHGIRRAAFTFYVRHWLKPQTDHKRSIDRSLLETLSPTLMRLLGFQRQTPVELPDGRSTIVDAPGATSFYS
jgi:ectoine hydroxylase-related dioxygenase (phytanoyl-CoA dioxygenase family)